MLRQKIVIIPNIECGRRDISSAVGETCIKTGRTSPVKHKEKQ